MKIVCLQHSALGGEIHLPEWARRRGHGWETLIVPTAGALPSAVEVDCLVVMGGPMSAWEEDRHPWLAAEKRLMEAVIAAGRPVLGICLGAQLLAGVLGARTYRGPRSEIGWRRLETTAAARADSLGVCLPATFESFLWHGDTFDLPDGAVHLARSADYAHQAFRWQQALALQFHLEARTDWVRRIVARDAAQLVPSPSTQTAEAILGRPEAIYRANNRIMDRLLDAWLAEGRGSM